MTNCNTNVGKKPHSHSYIYNSLRKGIVALAIPLAACGVHSDDDTAQLNTKAVSSHAPNTPGGELPHPRACGLAAWASRPPAAW